MPHVTDTWEVIHVIGIDDGGAAGLAEGERELIASADLLCGGERHLALFPAVVAERFRIKDNLGALYDVLNSAVGRRRAVVLASGDPCFYGIGPLLGDRLGAERVRIHTRSSSVAMAFARLGIGWQDATVVSVHGRPIDDAVRAAFTARKLAVLTDPEHTPAVVARTMSWHGIEDCPAYVCERLGASNERVFATSLAKLGGQEFDPLNVLILFPRPSVAVPLNFGRADSAYASRMGLITKAEVRAVTLSRLEPSKASVGWDIGAGSGSVAIEMSELMPNGTVYAIERDPQQLRVLETNVRRFPWARVRVVKGSAPEAFGYLLAPDTVFLGGSGEALEPILQAVAERLRPGGRLVANFALLEHLATWQHFAARLGWEHDIVQISVSRSAAIGEATRLSALNPVFITRLLRPEDAL